MKVRCRREQLLTATQLAAAAVPTREVKPVLRNLKTSVAADQGSILATDLELGLRLRIDGLTVEEPGQALLPARKVLDVLRESPDEELAIEADDHACLVRGQQNEYELPSEDPAHYPDVPTFDEDAYHEVLAGLLPQLIRRTLFAPATESGRYALGGCLWELDGNTARLVATDGRQLAVAEAPATSRGGHAPKGGPHVVPTKAMQLLERSLHDLDCHVRVSLRPNEALFQAGSATVYSRLLEGRYPPWKDVIPKKPATKVPLIVGLFLAVVRQAAVMAANDNRKVTFTFAEKRGTLQAQGAETGRSRVELPVDCQGKAIEIAFDPRYIIDMLRALHPDDELALELMDARSPALFRLGDDYRYVVMPLAETQP